MTEPQNHDSSSKFSPAPSSSSSSNSKQIPPEISKNSHSNTNASFSGHKGHYRNPPDVGIPDPATLREQWRYAIRQYSRWYSQAWGTAILAGVSFFALGWIIKGSNPLPSLSHGDSPPPSSSSSVDADKDKR